MGARSTTFTTYLNAVAEPGAEANITRYGQTTIRTYHAISDAAAQATTSAARLSQGGSGSTGRSILAALQSDLTAQIRAEASLDQQRQRAHAERIRGIAQEADLALGAIRRRQSAQAELFRQAESEGKRLLALDRQRIDEAQRIASEPVQTRGLFFDPAGAQQAAASARQQAIALGEVSRAAQEVARDTNTATASDRAFAAAAGEAAREAAVEAARLEDLANTQERVAQTAIASGNKQAVAGAQAVTSLRQQGLAQLQLGQQLQDVAVGFASGQRAGAIFAQQLPQIAFALSGVGGRIGAIATTLSGPWSVALVGGAFLLGTFVDKLLEGDDAAKKSEKSTLSLVDALSKQKFGTEESTKAINEYLKAQSGSRDAVEKNITLALQSAEAALKETVAKRQLIEALYEEERVRAAQSTRGAGGGIDPLITTNAKYEALRAKNKAALAEATAILTELNITDAKLSAESAVDPIKKINRQYDDMAAAAERAAAGNLKLSRSLKQTLIDIERRREASLKAQRDADKTDRRTSSTAGEIATFDRPVGGRISSGFGARTAPTAGASTNHRGIDIAAANGTTVKAPQVGTVVAIGFDSGLGKYVVIDHGAGTKTRYGHLSDNSVVTEGQRVEQGQAIGRVGSTGRSTGNHLHYEVLRNGKKVDPTTGRFPIDPVATSEAAERAADKQRKLDDALADSGKRAAERIARINEQFDAQPRLIDRAAQATRELDELIADVSEAKPPNFEQIVKDAERAKAVVQEGLVRPFTEFVRQSEENARIQDLLIQGRETEAQILSETLRLEREMGALDQQQLSTIDELVRAEERRNDAVASRQRINQALEGALESTRDAFEQLIVDLPRKGPGAAKEFLKQIQSNIQRAFARQITEKIFAGADEKLRNLISGDRSVETATVRLASQADRAGSASSTLR